MPAIGPSRPCLVLVTLFLLVSLPWTGSLSNDSPSSPSDSDEIQSYFPELNEAQTESLMLTGGRGVTQWVINGEASPGTVNDASNINSVWISDVVNTSGGGVIVTGSYRGDVLLGNTVNPTSYNRRMAFVGEMNQWGSWIWFKHTDKPSDSAGGAHSSQLSVGPAGIWICGWIYDTITFGSNITMTTGGLYFDGFVALYNTSTSSWLAANNFGGEYHDMSNACAATSSGGVYVGGTFRGTGFFGSSSHTSNGGADMYAAMVDHTGTVVWSEAWGGDYNDNITGIALDSSENAYFVGYYRDNVLNWPSQILVQAGLPLAAFVTKVDLNGSFQWASEIVGGATGDYVSASAVAYGNGDIYVGGWFEGQADFISGVSVALALPGNISAYNAWVASIDTTGSWKWASRSAGEMWSEQEITDIAVGPLGTVAVTGYIADDNQYWTNASFGDFKLFRGPEAEGFVAGLDPYGNWIWADGFGSEFNEYSHGVAWVGLGRVVTVGRHCVGSIFSCTTMFTGTNVSTYTHDDGSGYIWIFDVDTDLDGVSDLNDNCPTIANSGQENIDGDLLGDVCDIDADGDGYDDYYDDCIGPAVNWVQSEWTLDRDGDGCRDSDEDDDDDGDGIADVSDACDTLLTKHNWSSDSASDYDGDGCHDGDEDSDDDSDSLADVDDACPRYPHNKSWTSSSSTDYDGDGCDNNDDDSDDDNDGIADDLDNCPMGDLDWVSSSESDFDSDGCLDSGEDFDDDGDSILDYDDDCLYGATNWNSQIETDRDGDGCRDFDEDDDDDGDSLLDEDDYCPTGDINWISVAYSPGLSPNAITDHDGDGCRDSGEDHDDDGDSVLDQPFGNDACPRGKLNWTSNAGNDADSDGCHDLDEDNDIDNDGYPNSVDICPSTPFNEPANISSQPGCSYFQIDSDNDQVINRLDLCVDVPAAQDFDANQDGCTDDIDNDGVLDDVDSCRFTPEDERTNVDENGCGYLTEQDEDKDGVLDILDSCDDTSTQSIRDAHPEYVFDAFFGCWTGDEDDDDDNYPNFMDLCPDSDVVNYSVTDNNGCDEMQQDWDGDNVPNGVDGCPNTASGAVVNSDGCSQQQLAVDSDDGLSTGAIIGILLTVVVVIVAGAIAAIVIIKNKQKANKDKRRKSRRETDAAVAKQMDAPEDTQLQSEDSVENYEDDPNYKVDEDGCEWWLDEDRKWWFRTPEMDDWMEHTGE
ncbi:MAG: thrombospondin type 3 repeat-containing protein [Candidatus Thermoplasmatota archaeon]|nr:thrombospondin type 3 repeat-containing protein [Candidatus Thermoplasmatota archaeon]MEE3083211.1 thrombospondin type 3 repeat-containing protein [Candidatus Thermoplasmatota archaeon]